MSTTAPSQTPQNSNSNVPNVANTSQSLATGLGINATIQAYCNAMNNTVLTNLGGDWYTTFAANLATAQSHCTQYLTTIGPDFFSIIPNALVKYGTTFQTAVDMAEKIAGHPKGADGALTSDQVTQIQQLISSLLIELQTIEGTAGQSNIGLPPNTPPTLQGLNTDLGNWLNSIQNDARNLTSGQNSAQTELVVDQGTITQINSDISTLGTDIQALNKDLTAAEVGTGVAIFVATAGFALAVASGGAAIAVCAAGVVGFGGAVAADVIYSDKIKADQAKVLADQSSLSQEQAQVTALEGIIQSIQGLGAANSAAQSAIEGMLDTWSTLNSDLNYVVGDLQSADPTTMPAILEKACLKEAAADWKTLVTFAQGILNSTVTTQTVTAPPSGSAG